MIDNTDLSYTTILLRLFVALLLGAAVGLERERVERAAGLRTVTLVCLGSALFMIISSHGFFAENQAAGMRFDPSRLAAQVVSGIGFLGAGAILLRRDVVRGLTTAATIWAVAAIGLAAGAGLMLPAVTATVMIIFVLMVLKPVERRLFRRPSQVLLAFTMPRRQAPLADVRSLVERLGGIPRTLVLREVSAERDHFELLLVIPRELTADQLLSEVRGLQGVANVVLDQQQPAALWQEDETLVAKDEA